MLVAVVLGVVGGTPGRARADGSFEIIPQLGIGEPTGKGSSGYGPGLGLAVALGERITPLFSLHGELGYDWLNFSDVPAGIDISGHVLHLLAAPAFHAASGQADLSLGPTLGFFQISNDLKASQLSSQASATAHGWQLGVRIMVLIAFNPSTSVGPYFSFARLWASKVCVASNGAAEICDDSPSNNDEGFWNLGIAARF